MSQEQTILPGKHYHLFPLLKISIRLPIDFDLQTRCVEFLLHPYKKDYHQLISLPFIDCLTGFVVYKSPANVSVISYK